MPEKIINIVEYGFQAGYSKAIQNKDNGRTTAQWGGRFGRLTVR